MIAVGPAEEFADLVRGFAPASNFDSAILGDYLHRQSEQAMMRRKSILVSASI